MAAESTPRPTAEEMASSLRPGETIEDVWKDIYNPEGYDYELGESGSDLEPEQYEEQGRSLDAHVTSPWDPLDFVEGTDHPLARFPGNPLTWESSLFDDGTSSAPAPPVRHLEEKLSTDLARTLSHFISMEETMNLNALQQYTLVAITAGPAGTAAHDGRLGCGMAGTKGLPARWCLRGPG